ncbi:tyrosine-type recombinase/integrase [Microbulbifer sp. CAU 1566]|uniref:tyrosine-type recombinase/integrase n=1 Tax=Microbulbifer sp. CAU 1566 TaxID=2933269 RepID=UPI002005EE41|nr:site-specific integrase [Microbulbifer sp. CAU 1566]MCK7596908.1 tyrosine-type recombinase/integrase [Microbulbifer sp. CAU 1566]
MPNLTAKKVEALLRAGEKGEHSDGKWLFLQVTGINTGNWYCRPTFRGKRPKVGLGSVDAVSLAEARLKRDDVARMIRAGLDPIAERKKAAGGEVAFEQQALAYIESQRPGWKSPKQAPQWESSLRTYAFPTIGKKTPATITTEDALRILRPIWDAKPETARRVRNRCELVWDAAKAQGFCEGENPFRWRGHLDKLLSKQKAKPRGHHAALPWPHMSAFWQAIKDHPDLSARAVRLTLLSALRTSEVIGAQWDEFDLKNRLWTVPAERMKAKKAHRVPLSTAAVAELEALPRVQGSDYLFPGQRGAKHMSNMAMLNKVRGMDEVSVANGGDGWRDENGKVITIHGFRSSFRDWAAECSHTPNIVAEMALAHTISSDVEKSYRRGDLLEKRAALMQEWADFVTGGEA